MRCVPKWEEKTRTLENHKDAAPEIALGSDLLATRQPTVSQTETVGHPECQDQACAPPAERETAPAFWQRRFYDFNVWSAKKCREKLTYMHRNPVDRQLVQHPCMWPWSSWSFYAKGDKGLIQIDVLNPTEGKSAKVKQTKNPHP